MIVNNCGNENEKSVEAKEERSEDQRRQVVLEEIVYCEIKE